MDFVILKWALSSPGVQLTQLVFFISLYGRIKKRDPMKRESNELLLTNAMPELKCRADYD